MKIRWKNMQRRGGKKAAEKKSQQKERNLITIDREKRKTLPVPSNSRAFQVLCSNNDDFSLFPLL